MDKRTYISVILPLRLEWEPCYSVPSGLEVAEGDRVKVPFSGREYTGVVSRVNVEPDTAPSKIREIICLEHGLGRISREETDFWRCLADYYLCTVGEVYKAAYPAGKVSNEAAHARALLKAAERKAAAMERERVKEEKRREVLEKRLAARQEALARAKKDTVRARLENEIASIREALAEMERPSIKPVPEACVESTSRKSIMLSEAQKRVYDGIREGFCAGKVVLLDGVTGSGKTEVYLRLAEDTLAEGRNVLYMVPEIALSRQLEDRLRIVFGDRLLIFHSGESTAHRREVAGRVREGSYIVLGTRSSIFLPHHDLGLVIVDEEHDSSYKQESPAPRYNGRDAAVMLAGVHSACRPSEARCCVLLGSATPSLESLYNCGSGKYAKVDLKERYYGSGNAEVEIIDTVAERRKRGMVGTFSRKLIDRIAGVIGSGGQIIILRARRSYSPVMQCSGCGFIPKCPYCNVSLSYHKMKGRLVCHYCGHGVPYMQVCPKCGSPMVGLGAGTQKVEEELSCLFPDAVVARLDSDTAQSRVYENRIIKEFAEKKIDILVGTQIVTKGFDFPGLAMVAVLQADTLVGMQDFRADEKAMQILEQFRGRCGRRGDRGVFVIQTAQPEHPVYRRMASGESTAFSSELLRERQAFGYPPFSRIVHVIARDQIEDRAARMLEGLAAVLRDNSMNVAGPFVPGSGMAEGSHIRMLRICIGRDRHLRENKILLKRLVTDFESRNRYMDHFIMDVDPS